MSRISGLHSDFDRLHAGYQTFHDDSEEDAAPPLPSYQNTSPAWCPANVASPSSSRRPTKEMAEAGDVERHRDEEHHSSNVMLHMVPEGSKSRWSHIEDLDSFFRNVYEYHQRHGFKVMMLQKFCDLGQFLFIIVWSTFVFECVDYGMLFGNKTPAGKADHKMHLSDVVLPPGRCVAGFSLTTWTFLIVTTGFWTWKALAVFYQVFQYWDIKSFYNQALKIDDDELDCVTWNDVQRRLVEAQSDYLMCIHKKHLTELDVYHRILRFKNYLVAMVNKDLLPVRIRPPCLPEVLFLSQGMKWNIEFLLFKGPWAPFDKWHLKEDYKKTNKRKELTGQLQNKIALVAVVNLLLMPLIFFWQLLYSFYNYAELVKREPGSLGVRRWSRYGQLYLRHFNEHDHELRARLNRAYRPTNHYMEIFVSPVAAVVARFVGFISASVLGVLLLLVVWDEDVLNVEHALTVVTVLGGVVAASRVFVPDPNIVFSPEKTLTCVMAHIHYFPVGWKGRAHTRQVMQRAGELFPYTAVNLLHELVSPLVTPFILMFSLRPKASQVVDFFRNFTVDIVGVGDVCSFAQMDVRRHGNSKWQRNDDQTVESVDFCPAAEQAAAEDGKTEMSLVNFTLKNPEWKPSQDSENFLAALRNQAARDAEVLPTLTEETLNDNPLYASLTSLDAAGGIYSELAAGLLNEAQNLTRERPGDGAAAGDCLLDESSAASSVHRHGGQGKSSIMMAASQARPGFGSLLVGASMLSPPPNLRQDLRRLGLEEYTAADMSLSALYLHEVHQRATASSMSKKTSCRSPPQSTNHQSQKKPSLRRQVSLKEESEEVEEEAVPLVESSARFSSSASENV